MDRCDTCKHKPTMSYSSSPCNQCVNGSERVPSTMDVLTASARNIRDNIETFVKLSRDCDHMITERLEPTGRCRHKSNDLDTCGWVFCPLWDSE